MSHQDDGIDEYEVEAVLKHAINNGRLYFLVKWKDWESQHNMWLPSENLDNADELLGVYLSEHPDAGRLLEEERSGRLLSDRRQRQQARRRRQQRGPLARKPTTNMPKASPSLKAEKRHVANRLLSPPAVSPSTGNFDKTPTEVLTDGQTVSSEEGMEREQELSVDNLECLEISELPACGFQRNLKPVEVLASLIDNRQPPRRLFVMMWENGESDLVLCEDAAKNCPDVVIAFYEKHLRFDNDL